MDTPDTLDTEPEWITADEAGRRLGKTGKTVRRWVMEGRLPGQMIDGKWMVDSRTLSSPEIVRTSSKPSRSKSMVTIEAHETSLKQLLQMLTNTQQDLFETSQRLGEATNRATNAEQRAAAAETRAVELEQQLVALAVSRITEPAAVPVEPNRDEATVIANLEQIIENLHGELRQQQPPKKRWWQR